MTDREYLIALGKNVRARRQSLGLSMPQVAELMGMNYKTVWRMEAAIKAPQITTLKKIAEVLNTSVQSLLP